MNHSYESETLETDTIKLNENFFRSHLSTLRLTPTGIKTGFVDYDYQQGGFLPGRTYLIGGRPSVGKTAFTLNLLRNIAVSRKVPVAYFSLELSKEHIANRLLSMEAGIDESRLETGVLTPNQWTDLEEAAQTIATGNIVINDTPGLSVEALEIALGSPDFENAQIVFLDYLQLLSTEHECKLRDDEIRHICRELKEIAVRKNIALVVVSQISRDPDRRKDHRPVLNDLCSMNVIEDFFDSILFLYRDEYYDKDSEEKGIAEIITAKNAHGVTGTVRLAWLADVMRFCSLEPY